MVFIQAFHLDENTPSNLWGWNLRLKASTKVPKQGTFFQGKIVESFLPLGNLGGNVSGFSKSRKEFLQQKHFPRFLATVGLTLARRLPICDSLIIYQAVDFTNRINVLTIVEEWQNLKILPPG